VTPDPRFLFENASYQEAYANLFYGIRERKGFIVLTGEVGTGKTTLLRKAMDSLEDEIRFVFFYNTTLSFEELLDHIFTDLQLEHQSTDGRLKKIQVLNHFLISQLELGGTVALLIDEAQNLSDEILENLRLLSNLETAQEKLLQIVLVGQPELEEKLSQPNLRQLKQRIVTWCKLNHLKDNEIGPFLTHRLQISGYNGPPLFVGEAIQRIAIYSQGIPRLVNVICDNALLLAYAASTMKVSADLIEEAARDLQLLPSSRKIWTNAIIGNDRQISKPTSPFRSRAYPCSQPSPPQPNEEEDSSQSANLQQAIPNQGQTEPLWRVLFSRTQGFRLGVTLLLLLTSGIAAFGLIFSRHENIVSDSKTAGFIDTVVSLTYVVNGAFSSFFEQTIGQEAQEKVKTSMPQVTFQQEIPHGSIEVHSPDISPLETEENGRVVDALREKNSETSSHISGSAFSRTAAVSEQHDYSTELPPHVKDFQEAPIQQPLSTTPSLVAPQNVYLTKAQTIRLQSGTTILELVRRVYGSQNTLALVLIKDFNPQINDLDYVAAGETILAPSLTEETLLRKQPDGSYRLLLAVFPRANSAQKLANQVRQHGYRVDVSPAEVASSLSLQRVEIVGLPNREAGQQAWTFVDMNNVLTAAPHVMGKAKPMGQSPPREKPEEFLETGL